MIQWTKRRLITPLALTLAVSGAGLTVPATASAQDEALAQLPDSVARRIVDF
jgi:hypothetical protein